MPITKRQFRRCLKRKFGFEEVAGSKHEALSLIVSGKKVATTRFSRSRSGQDIGSTLLSQMAGQLWVNSMILQQMYSCDVDRDEYLKLLQQQGRLT